MRSTFRFSPWLSLAVTGDAVTTQHFAAEYGPPATDTPASEPSVAITFEGPRGSEDVTVRGGHKSIRWVVRFTAPDRPVLGAAIDIGGRPRGLGRTLVQSYFVEPLLSVAAARAGGVLLPAAAFVDDGAVVVIGRSGSGKTSMAMHALATGATLLGDDQVLVEGSGECGSFPRRLRLYPDLALRAPLAFDRLPGPLAVRLRFRGVIRRLSGGTIAPPLLVESTTFGGNTVRHPVSIRRVVLLERPATPADMRTEPATAQEAVSMGQALLREQRSRLPRTGAWAETIAETERRERETLVNALSRASVERVVAPFPLTGRQMDSLWMAVRGGARGSAGG